MGSDNTINKNPGVVNPPVVSRTPARTPAGAPPADQGSTEVGSPLDAAKGAAALRRMEGPRPFRTPALLGAVTPSERKLPGGSIDAAWGRAAEFGDQADRAATLVAYRHGLV